jgi:hypothetical protein
MNDQANQALATWWYRIWYEGYWYDCLIAISGSVWLTARCLRWTLGGS